MGGRRRRIYAERGRVAKIRDKKHLSNDFDIIVNPKRDLPSSRSTILLIFVILVEIKRKGNSSLEIFYSVEQRLIIFLIAGCDGDRRNCT